IANRKVVVDSEEAREHELKKIVLSSLQPFVGDHTDIVLQHCRPISETNGFSAEIYLSKMSGDNAFVVQKVLNAGATMGYIQLRAEQDQSYYVHKQLYKTLLLIAAAAPKTGQRSRAPQLGGRGSEGEIHGGSLNSRRPALAAAADHRALPSSALLIEGNES